MSDDGVLSSRNDLRTDFPFRLNGLVDGKTGVVAQLVRRRDVWVIVVNAKKPGPRAEQAALPGPE
jgi:hypothetical protein